jgi:hypothetical protein
MLPSVLSLDGNMNCEAGAGARIIVSLQMDGFPVLM